MDGCSPKSFYESPVEKHFCRPSSEALEE